MLDSRQDRHESSVHLTSFAKKTISTLPLLSLLIILLEVNITQDVKLCASGPELVSALLIIWVRHRLPSICWLTRVAYTAPHLLIVDVPVESLSDFVSSVKVQVVKEFLAILIGLLEHLKLLLLSLI